jgi:hypothetical protein
MRFVALMGTMLFWGIMFFLGIKAALTYFAIMVAITYLWLKTENNKKDILFHENQG